MLRLPEFEFFRPATLSEAAEALASGGPGTLLVSGGTDLWPKMKRRQMEPQRVIAVRHLRELHRLDGSPEKGMVLGAGLTLHELERDHILCRHYPALARAAHSISSPPLKTMGTLGGNLCVDTRCNYYDQTHEWRKSIDFCLKKDGDICWVAPGSPRCWALSSTDLAPVMLALEARFLLISRRGERLVRADDFYSNDGIRYLNKEPDEILAEVRLPAAGPGRMVFKKLRRRGSIDFPILNVAAWLRMDSTDTVCEEARIAIGAVSSRPFLCREAAEALRGVALNPDSIEAAAHQAYRHSRPMDNADLNFSWRHKMVPVWVRRALQEIASGSWQSPREPSQVE